MSIILTEKRLRNIIRKCITEARGIYYDKKIINEILTYIYYMLTDGERTIVFNYDGYDYRLTTSPMLYDKYFVENPNAIAACRESLGLIEIMINPSVLSSNIKNAAKSCSSFEDFAQTEVYKNLEPKLRYVLAHEITHAQKEKKIIDRKRKNGDIFFDSEDDSNIKGNGEFDKTKSSKLEGDVVYWFSPIECQARLSQGYVRVKTQIDFFVKQFGEESLQSINSNYIYECLYKTTESNYLDKLYDELLSTQPTNLSHILTKKSDIFRPRTNKLNYEYKRLIGKLKNIMEYNKNKLIKITGLIIDEIKG